MIINMEREIVVCLRKYGRCKAVPGGKPWVLPRQYDKR